MKDTASAKALSELVWSRPVWLEHIGKGRAVEGRSERRARARLCGILSATVRSLDFIPSNVRSWRKISNFGGA